MRGRGKEARSVCRAEEMMNEGQTTGAPRRGRGYALFSGGLDSQLAVCLLKEQGLQIEGLVFASPFFKTGPAKQAAARLGLPLRVIDFTADIVGLLDAPPHGFGRAMNPCTDCHAGMIRRAGEMMRADGFDFVATGEVVNQRPKSQNRQALGIVEREAGIAGRLLRPLSALLLEPTLPEKEGLVDRSRLLGISGRGRKEQMALAARFGLTDYPSPAGGCLLTEKGFARKLADLKEHEGLGGGRQIRLLLHGRHFRLPGGAKCIAGRDARDNQTLKRMFVPGDVLIHTVDVPGPTLLLPGGAAGEDLALACGICAEYGDHAGREEVTVRIARGENGGDEERRVRPLPKESFRPCLL